MSQEENEKLLVQLVAHPVFAQGMRPLSHNAIVAVYVDEDPFILTKTDDVPTVSLGAPEHPNITFTIPCASLKSLLESNLSDVATTGIAILKLMLAPDPKLRASARVHVGLFDLMRLGYLSVLPLGGAPMMKFLAIHGLSGIGKIKDAISKLRDTDGK